MVLKKCKLLILLFILSTFAIVMTNCTNSGCEKQFHTLTGIDSARALYVHHPDSFPDTLYLKSEVELHLYYNTEPYDSVYVTEKLIKTDCYEIVNVPDSIRVFKIDSVGDEIDYSSSFSFGTSDNLVNTEIKPYRFPGGPILPIKLTGKLPSDRYTFNIKHYKNGEVLFSSKTKAIYLKQR